MITGHFQPQLQDGSLLGNAQRRMLQLAMPRARERATGPYRPLLSQLRLLAQTREG